MPIFAHKKFNLHYEFRKKNADFPLLVLLHGFTGALQNWEEIESHLQANCLLLDLPGHGKSHFLDCEMDFSADDFGDAVIALLTELQAEKFLLLGYSMGGRLALHAAVQHPQKFSALILESANPGIPEQNAREIRRAEDETRADSIEKDKAEFMKSWANIPMFQFQKKRNPIYFEKLQAVRQTNKAQQLASALRFLGPANMPDNWRNLHKLNMPCLLITGDEDGKYCKIAEDMSQTIPSAKLETIRFAHHNCHLENTAHFTHAVNHFLRQLETKQ